MVRYIHFRNLNMMNAEDVEREIGVSKGYAYKLIREMNKELVANGYVVVAGKIPRAFWEKKFYGFSDVA